MAWLAAAAHALQVQIRAEPPALTVGQTGSVSVVIVSGGRGDAEPASHRPPRIPVGPGIRAEFSGEQGQSYQNVSGRITRIQRFGYRVTALEKGTWTVGPVDIPLSDGTIAHSEPVQIAVGDRPAQTIGGPPAEFGIEVAFDDTTLWEGQLVVLKAKFQSRLPGAQVRWRVPGWDGLQVPQQGSPSENSYTVADPDQGTVTVDEVKIPLLAVATGPRDQGVVTAEVSIPVGNGLFAFARARTEHAVSDRLQVDIQPLPPAPSGFTGLVGDVRLTSDLSPSGQVAVGQSIDWTLTVSGSGSLDGFTMPAYVAAQTLVYEKGVDREAGFERDAFVGKAAFHRVIVPTEPGPLHFPPVQVVAFSPTQGTYVTHTVELPTLTVVPGRDVATAVERYGTPGSMVQDEAVAVEQVRPPYRWGRASSPSIAKVLPALLGIAAAPGLFVLARWSTSRIAAEILRRRRPRAAPSGVFPLLGSLPSEPAARWAAFDRVLQRLAADPRAPAEAVRTLRIRLGRVRFGDGQPDPAFEADLRALVAEVEA